MTISKSLDRFLDKYIERIQSGPLPNGDVQIAASGSQEEVQEMIELTGIGAEWYKYGRYWWSVMSKNTSHEDQLKFAHDLMAMFAKRKKWGMFRNRFIGQLFWENLFGSLNPRSSKRTSTGADASVGV